MGKTLFWTTSSVEDIPQATSRLNIAGNLCEIWQDVITKVRVSSFAASPRFDAWFNWRGALSVVGGAGCVGAKWRAFGTSRERQWMPEFVMNWWIWKG